MRHYLKSLIIATASFYLAYTMVPTISFGGNPKNLAFIIGGLFLISLIINPIFSFILLPINFLTFGSVSLILNGIYFFFLPRFVDFSIGAYNFPGATIEGIIIPAVNFNAVAAIILVTSIVTLSQKILHFIFE
ncbi:MAG: hypothetical protein ACD_57C00319G0002 [uncultured bacterium]|nr:MAG: hypothetical protein ACD_57C00319G0002 [uncultured bacterium]OGD78369.1 MAG: hypothetical protein A2683_00430 [Candidatus Curtissbacteria bacterium RIFCSPHIGHO2_01_FULL_34_40]OGD92794.1 MAG: hypothetical protein A3E14_00180 [Candidatus Curtissbacteria bacterium RIFCSPHIGHO2_12_FULL_41_13]OGD95134.1 MAG: hypothetical protein A3B52_00385 [Candidatus Curtissbacteria bacterium RIFCSPLOWO2_01_FULL_41_28]OGE15884.1 MAG: hypothetical protein A2495_01900 [Candidatus Curtissbacteria bacterium RI